MPQRDRSERGASLVMAMVFLVVGSLIAVALTEQSTGNIQNTSQFQNLRAVNYAADAAMDGAIQQTRYHGSCETFPKSGTLQISNEYVYVTCSTTPVPQVVALETKGSGTLSDPSPVFIQLDALTNQPVYSTSGAKVGVITSVSSDGTTATMSTVAGATGTVYVGEVSQTYDTFLACASSSSISACAAANKPEITAKVLFNNVNTSPPPATELGANAKVYSWVVFDANA